VDERFFAGKALGQDLDIGSLPQLLNRFRALESALVVIENCDLHD